MENIFSRSVNKGTILFRTAPLKKESLFKNHKSAKSNSLFLHFLIEKKNPQELFYTQTSSV